jgi:hypothetical protein
VTGRREPFAPVVRPRTLSPRRHYLVFMIDTPEELSFPHTL